MSPTTNSRLRLRALLARSAACLLIQSYVFFVPQALAQTGSLAVSPAHPIEGQPTTLLIVINSGFPYTSPQISQSGSTFEAFIIPTGPISTPTTAAYSLQLGVVPAGSYNAELQVRDPSGTVLQVVSRLAFSVAPTSAHAIPVASSVELIAVLAVGTVAIALAFCRRRLPGQGRS